MKPTRQSIIKAADTLFYQQGYEHTSFADIASAVDISRGNFYYHFKTKDDILNAVIDYRLEKTQIMLDDWEACSDQADERIRQFIQILIMNKTKIMNYGCPVGTLCTELAKLNHHAEGKANQVFTLFKNWLSKQFKLAGQKRGSDKLAMHLLARSQGIATLANAFHDDVFIKSEVKTLNQWLDSILDQNK